MAVRWVRIHRLVSISSEKASLHAGIGPRFSGGSQESHSIAGYLGLGRATLVTLRDTLPIQCDTGPRFFGLA